MIGFNMKTGEIYLENVSKIYKIRSGRLFQGVPKTFITLDNLNLEIKSGDRLGLIGKNGSGKTTLLKIISGVTTVSKGNILVFGKTTSLLDLGAGFHPDLSGLDNIMLNGLLAGLSRGEVKKLTQSIIDYSGLSKFINMPFYTYSSGMKLKLAFAIAIHADPDILVFDEIVSAGDEQFIKMFATYFDKLLKQKKTLIFATHILEVLPFYCNKTLWLENGKIKQFGETNKVIAAYKQSDY